MSRCMAIVYLLPITMIEASPEASPDAFEGIIREERYNPSAYAWLGTAYRHGVLARMSDLFPFLSTFL